MQNEQMKKQSCTECQRDLIVYVDVFLFLENRNVNVPFPSIPRDSWLTSNSFDHSFSPLSISFENFDFHI